MHDWRRMMLGLGMLVVAFGLFALPVTAAAPQITAVTISGTPNTQAHGAAVFDPVQVRITADHFTDDNLLTPAGLGWNRDSRVVPLSGRQSAASTAKASGRAIIRSSQSRLMR
ncbi:hypothetical protein [Pseudoramibacter faecis]|uniref:hypothetical protein n=1 Tax=Pseudoramibacter faecis TaxID=3108534 RepID=UPI002E76DD45|nr:hypothetical protein [Pseudoramibacter sp. HA2172]